MALIGLAVVAPAGAEPGDLDSGFGDDGIVVLDVGFSTSVQDVAIQPDGKIVLAGYLTYPDGSQDFHVSRLNPDGSYDTS